MQQPKAKQLPSGMWYCRVRINGQDISITRRTEKDAVAEAIAIKAGIKHAQTAPLALTLDAALGAYIDSQDGLISASTIRGYNAIRDNRFQMLKNLSLGRISPAQWQAEIKREAKLVAPKTIKNAWGLVTAVLRRNKLPVPDVTLPAPVNNEHPYLMPSQIPGFLDAIRGKEVELPALLGLHSLRRSEILDITWADIDLQRSLIYVRGAAVYDKKNKILHKPTNKNETSHRTVPILIPRLSELLTAASRDALYVVNCNPNTIWTQVNRICRTCGLPEIGTHGLRHSFASLAYSVGMSEETTMRIGGWSNMQTMRKIYTHVSAMYLADDAKKMSDFYANIKNGDENDDGNYYSFDLQRV